jgi:DNA-binding CsgD family transcriptional regulator
MNAQHSADSAAASWDVAKHGRPGLALVTTARSDGHAAHFAVVEGATGTGKSALLGRATAAAADAGSLVLRANASARERDFPLGLVRQLFELPLVTAAAQDRGAWLRGPAALVPRVLSLGNGHAADSPGGEHITSHAVFWLAANISRQRPLMILIDDLQWADFASLRWLIHLARRMANLPLTVVVTIGSGQGADDDDLIAALLAEVRRMPLASLSDSVPGQLMADCLAVAPTVPPAPAVRPIANRPPGRRTDFGPAALTAHEHRLIGMAVNGRTNSEIAEQFGVTRRAVEFHFTQIYRKLGIARRPQLYRFAHAEAALCQPCRNRTRRKARLMSTVLRSNEVRLTGARKRCRVTDLARLNSRRPSAPCTRPKPDSAVPPKGSAGTAAKVTTELMDVAPVRNRRAVLIDRARSAENTAEPRPCRLSLASVIASSMSRTRLTTTTGPKVSSVIAMLSSGTSVSTTGRTYGGRTESMPPTTARPPRRSASSTCAVMTSSWPGVMIGP